MDTVKNVEKAGRQVWLAGLGAVLLGKEYAVDKFDEMFEGTNSLVNQVVTKGQEIEGELKGKFSGDFSLSRSFPQNEKLAELREKLGLNKESKQIKISRLAVKVDALTEIVTALNVRAEEKKAAAEKKSAAEKASAKTETTEVAPKIVTTKTETTKTESIAPRKSGNAARKPRVAATTTAKKPATSRTTAGKTTVAQATGSTQSKTDKE